MRTAIVKWIIETPGIVVKHENQWKCFKAESKDEISFTVELPEDAAAISPQSLIALKDKDLIQICRVIGVIKSHPVAKYQEAIDTWEMLELEQAEFPLVIDYIRMQTEIDIPSLVEFFDKYFKYDKRVVFVEY